MENKKDGRGGARPGNGRPATNRNDYDFEEMFGSKDAMILVIALSYDCEL